MSFRSLKSFFPTADELLRQELSKLGAILLKHLKSYEGLNTVYQNAGLNRGYFRAMLESRNVGLGPSPKEPEYGVRQPEVTKRMMEAWNWLERQGLLIRNDEQVGDWFIISSDGDQLLKSRETSVRDNAGPDHSRMAKTKADEYRSAFAEYTIIGDPIGEGGSGIVYAVSDAEGRRFALKAVTPQKATTQKLKRFQNEVRFCQRTDHKNIVRILDTGRSGSGSPFYVMELYPCTLQEQIGKLNADEVLPVFSEILNGVEAAHLSNVIHRDLKPQNILCDPPNRLYVVADFGIASFGEDDLYTLVETQPNQRLANFQYAAPEQKIRGRAVDSKADVYALGLILNQMYTGEIPAGTQFRRVQSVAPSFSFVDELIEQMIRQDPAQRPSIAGVKQQLLARQQQFVSLQKIHELTKQVVPLEVVGDPLVVDPIRPIKFDYENEELLVTLSQIPNPQWIELFQSQATQQFVGMGPKQSRFHRGLLVVPVRKNIVVQQKAYVEGWIRNANGLYEESVKRNIALQKRERELALQQELEKERERQEILKLLS